MALCLGEPPTGFLLLLLLLLSIQFCSSVHFVVVLHFIFDLHFVVVLHSLLFNIIPHPFVDYRRVLHPFYTFSPAHPFYTFSPAHHRVIRNTFIFNLFRDLLSANATVLSRRFLTTGVFYFMLLHRHF